MSAKKRTGYGFEFGHVLRSQDGGQPLEEEVLDGGGHGVDGDVQLLDGHVRVLVEPLEEQVDVGAVAGHPVQPLGVQPLPLDVADGLLQEDGQGVVGRGPEVVQRGARLVPVLVVLLVLLLELLGLRLLGLLRLLGPLLLVLGLLPLGVLLPLLELLVQLPPLLLQLLVLPRGPAGGTGLVNLGCYKKESIN